MFKRTTLIALSAIAISTHADSLNTCFVELAVAPPVDLTQKVAFNVSNSGASRSATLFEGSSAIMSNLLCSSEPYVITATVYSNSIRSLITNPGVGQCMLRNGPVVLSQPGNSVSVVFPNDFDCNY